MRHRGLSAFGSKLTPRFTERSGPEVLFLCFLERPHFSGPAPIFFKYNRNWFDFLPPAWQWRRRGTGWGQAGGTRPTAGSRHASVAAVAELNPPHQLLFSHLKAVYEADPGRPSVGGNWDESKGKREKKTKKHTIAFNRTTPPTTVNTTQCASLLPLRTIFQKSLIFVLCTFIKPLQKHDLTPCHEGAYQPSNQKQLPTKACSL